MDSNDEIQNTVAAPITAALAGLAITANPVVAITLAGITFLFGAGLNLGKMVSKEMAKNVNEKYGEGTMDVDAIGNMTLSQAIKTDIKFIKGTWETSGDLWDFLANYTKNKVITVSFVIDALSGFKFTELREWIYEKLPDIFDLSWLVFKNSKLGKFLTKIGLVKEQKEDGDIGNNTISGKFASAVIDVVTNKEQAQRNINETISQVNRSGSTTPLGASVVNDPVSDTKHMCAGISKELQGYMPMLAEVGNNPVKDAKNIFEPTQSEFGLNDFHTGVSLDDTGLGLNAETNAGFSSKNLTTGVSLNDSGESLLGRLQGGLAGRALSVGVNATSGKDIFNTIKNEFDGAKRVLSLGVNVALDMASKVIGKKAGGGLFSNGSWKPITAYAGGGLPGTGQLFLARERGPEMVGTIGGHTAVMNNNQIVSSVAAGVANAVASVMSTFAGNSSSPEVHVYVGGKELTDYVIKDVNGRTIATGVCPITT